MQYSSTSLTQTIDFEISTFNAFETLLYDSPTVVAVGSGSIFSGGNYIATYEIIVIKDDLSSGNSISIPLDPTL